MPDSPARCPRPWRIEGVEVARVGVVSLHGVVYEVDAALVGQTVTLRYDPARARRGIQVLAAGHPSTTAKPVDAYANCFVRRDHGSKLLTPQTPATPPPPSLPLRRLDEDC